MDRSCMICVHEKVCSHLVKFNQTIAGLPPANGKYTKILAAVGEVCHNYMNRSAAIKNVFEAASEVDNA